MRCISAKIFSENLIDFISCSSKEEVFLIWPDFYFSQTDEEVLEKYSYLKAKIGVLLYTFIENIQKVLKHQLYYDYKYFLIIMCDILQHIFSQNILQNVYVNAYNLKLFGILGFINMTKYNFMWMKNLFFIKYLNRLVLGLKTVLMYK